MIDISVDLSAIPPRPAGVGRYGIEMISELVPLARSAGIEIGVVLSESNAKSMGELIGSVHEVARSPSSRVSRLLWERVMLSSRLRGRAVRVHHGLHYTLPGNFNGAAVATIHDLTFFDHPEWHEPSKVWFFRRAIARASREARAIIVPSETTKAALLSRFSPRGEVKVVPHGIQAGLMRRGLEGSSSEERGQEILYVGTIEPRKGIVSLVQAFEILASQNPDVTLTVVGQIGWKAEESINALQSSKFGSRIAVRGYVPDEELARLFRRCGVFAYPSYGEGFGLPVLEAMSFGAPVVTSVDSAMEEVSKGVASLSRAGEVEGLADALRGELNHSEEQLSRTSLGRKVAASFTWERCASQHLELYRRLL